jgi:ferredoxin
MDKISLIERWYIPTYNDPKETKLGEVTVDYAKCTGCSICARTCPADAIVMEDKKAKLKPPVENLCMFCGDCMAICPERAIRMKSPFKYSGYFKTIDTGDIKLPRL